MKFLLTFPDATQQWPWEGAAYVETVRKSFEAAEDKRGHSLVTSAEDADVILFLEPNSWKDRSYAEVLLKNPLIREHPEKCFAVGYSDSFLGFLPGLYTGVPKKFVDHSRYETWCYLLGSPNPLVEKVSALDRARDPRWLFSFRGTGTAPVREAIFQHAAHWPSDAIITRLQQGSFFSNSAQQQSEFVEEILNSQFVLCPRGISPSSHRLYETMACGRAPVILADDWSPPPGPDWKSFAIFVKEAEVSRIPSILNAEKVSASERGRLARRAWEEWFSPVHRVTRAFDLTARMRAARHGVPDYERLWRSWRFYAPYGLAPHQKLWRNLREGTLLQKAKAKLKRS
ncbi:MAG TPA: exostosin family protein [Methylomirabilota bacterium]|nr:exostosin family protein [Methylomirabilota bacterium]